MALALALPATTPRGDVLDLVTDHVGPGTAAGQEPTVTAAEPAILAPSAAGTPKPTDVAEPYDLVDAIRSAVIAAPTGPAPAKSLSGYAWPIAHPRITLPFGPTPWGTFVVDGDRFHDGIDIATFCGDRIMAAHDGTVIAAGRHFDDAARAGSATSAGTTAASSRTACGGSCRWWWSIDDGNGYRSVYAHFGELRVQRGDRVRVGQLLGFEGATGHATGCHLHYGLFSPAETATYKLNAATAKRMKLPRYELARIDPFKVLPPRPRPTATDARRDGGARARRAQANSARPT